MLSYFRKRKLNKAFTKYVHVLGPALVQRYGLRDQFTVVQVQATAEHLKIDTRFIAYAVALYRHEESENTIKLLGVDQEFLDRLRSEIASSIFGGKLKYTSQDVLSLSKKTGWRGGPPPNWMANKHGHTSL
jgi:hypothetical protein